MENILFKRICVVGLGYIGLPTAATFAANGVEVIGVDINPLAVNLINQGKVHFVEPDLDSLVQTVVRKRALRAQSIPAEADAFIIAVPTPFKEENQPDLQYIEAAANAIAPFLEKNNIIILESTSPVGATEQLIEWLSIARPDLTFPRTGEKTSDVLVAYCPERVLPGNVLKELISNDRIIGGMNEDSSQAASNLYKLFVEGNCIVTDARTAEMTKLTENSYRDVQIGFANELSVICDKLEINVWELITLANRHPRVNILQPGPGVGGHCIAVDPWFIISSAPEEAKLIRMARIVNDEKTDWVIKKINNEIKSLLESEPHIKIEDITLACFGLAFKPDIDDLRESPAMKIARKIASSHIGRVLAVEPNIKSLNSEKFELVDMEYAEKNADIAILLVDHKEFKKITRPDVKRYIDTRGIWK